MIEGTVLGLQRVADIQDGADMGATTMHICIFNLDETRVQLGGWTPPPIADGDRLRVVGRVTEGLFDGIVCRDLTTGWITPDSDQRGFDMRVVFVVFASVFIAILSTLLIGWFSILIPPVAYFIFAYLDSRPSSAQVAREMLMS